MLKGEATRQRIVDAAIQTLKAEGFAGTSARAVARTGGFNQALVFYHFGGMTELLLAALDETSARRMARYRDALEGVQTLPELLGVAGRVFREDLDDGHMTVLAEVIAAASAVDGLGAQVVARIEPWTELTAETLGRVLAPSGLDRLAPVADIAFAIVGLYLGVELLTHLDGDRARAASLFAAVRRASTALAPG